MALTVLTAAAIAYQGVVQVLDLPGRLSPGAMAITTAWALVNIAMLSAVVLWARTVRHRRRSHRFPVRLGAAYGLGDAPAARAGQVTNLSRHGARVLVQGPLAVNERMTLVLLLLSGPVRVRGTVAACWPGPTPGSSVAGVEFDTVSADAADAIIEWCFQNPFGPDFALSEEAVESDVEAALAAAAQIEVSLAMAAAAGEPAADATAQEEEAAG
jgi:hypothetical protein